MPNTYQIIDESSWKRATHCQIFRTSIEPHYCVTLELDISEFLANVKAKKSSFTMSLIYVVASCANEIAEFRYRFMEGKVVIYDKIDTSFAYLNKDTELFKVVNVELNGTIDEFVTLAKETAENQKEYFTGPLGNDVYVFSSMPWVSYTHISHTNSGKKDNATPIFGWGKFFERDGKLLLPFSVQVHHSFVDGIHIGKFVDLLQAKLNER